MSDKLNPKQAAFVAEWRKDRNGKHAAIRAGYSAKTAESKGSQLLRIVKVKNAIDVLDADDAVEDGVTRESLAAELNETRTDAKAVGQHSVAVSATMGKAKLYGLDITKSELQVTGNINFNTYFEPKPDNDS